MIRLKEPGERGGYMLVEMTPFDLTALINDEMYTIIKMESAKEESIAQAKAEGKPESSWDVLGLESRLRDARASFAELQRVQDDREALLGK